MDPARVWELWADPARWPEWNDQLESAEVEGDLAVGSKVTVKFKRGGKMVFQVTEFDVGHLFVDEAKLPGCRFGHEHRVEPSGSGSEITHRLYLRGFTSGLFARLFGRGRMRESVVTFSEREAEMAATPRD